MVDMCCPFDTYTITNKDTKANAEVIPYYTLSKLRWAFIVFYAWHVRWGISSHITSVEVNFNFILVCSRACHPNTPTFSVVFVKMLKIKRLRSHTKEVVASVYDYSNNQDLWNDFDCETMRWTSIRYSQTSFFIKMFFQNLGGFIAVLNRVKQHLVIILIIIVIKNICSYN